MERRDFLKSVAAVAAATQLPASEPKLPARIEPRKQLPVGHVLTFNGDGTTQWEPIYQPKKDLL